MRSAVTVSMVGTIFVLRRVLVARSEIALATKPDDRAALGRWRAGHVVTFALCEVVALYFLVLRFLGFTFTQVLPFYLAGFILLLYFAPRRPASAIG